MNTSLPFLSWCSSAYACVWVRVCVSDWQLQRPNNLPTNNSTGSCQFGYHFTSCTLVYVFQTMSYMRQVRSFSSKNRRWRVRKKNKKAVSKVSKPAWVRRLWSKVKAIIAVHLLFLHEVWPSVPLMASSIQVYVHLYLYLYPLLVALLHGKSIQWT